MQSQDGIDQYTADHDNQPDYENTPETQILHVHDLPQLYSKPSAASLIETLCLFDRSSYSASAFDENRAGRPGALVEPAGLASYLTGIVSSSLGWIENEETRERIWESASARLSERSGRSAASSMTRSFKINDSVTISLHEPSLTEDNLGFKTWTSSLLLARRLGLFQHHLLPNSNHVLELGSGTGLVGIAVACLWHTHVTLTDLPEIVPNLQLNINANTGLLSQQSALGESPALTASILDWSTSEPQPEASRFAIILAADPLYSPMHASILTRTVHNYLVRLPTSRFILELPLREGYAGEREDLRKLLEEKMCVIEEGTEIGFDDWEDSAGRLKQVECWWSVWCWKAEATG